MDALNPVEIPLISFDSRSSSQVFDRNGGLFNFLTFPKIKLKIKVALPESCYAVKIQDFSMAPILPPGSVALFCAHREPPAALGDVYAISVSDKTPVIRKVVRQSSARPSSQILGEGAMPPAGFVPRKSFMTPTPLHIPTSKVSPIDPETHEMVFVKPMQGEQELKMIPSAKIEWMHPLLYILKKSNK